MNNSLSNLVYLTHSEHAILHNKGKNLSEETKIKLSESKKGKNHPLYGKHHSEETKRKMSESRKVLRWFNDGVKSYRCRECPPGCVKGRLK